MTRSIKKPLGVTVRGDKAEFRLWAPHALGVQICGTFSNMQPVDLSSEGDGYWSLQTTAQPGQEYFYLLDIGEEAPLRRLDPRAKALTASENGNCVIVDDDFDWEHDEFTPPPVEEQIIYEMHIGTFNRADASSTGTFADAIEQLDYLQSLGINMIELMPISSMAFSTGWGYNPIYLFSVESMYGGRGACMKFVRECHKRGIGVILDVVYNHLHPDTDLWRFDGWSENDGGGIYIYNDDRLYTPWGSRLDFGRPEVREYILDNVEMWLSDYRMDGLRVDSTIYMRNTEGRDNDPPHDIGEAWSLLAEMTQRAKQTNPAVILIAEDTSSNQFITKPVEDGGCGFDAQWQTGFPHAVRGALNLSGEQNHTISAIAGELHQPDANTPFRKVIFSDSHDTAANGSARINQVATPKDAASLFARQSTLLASAITLTAPGIPMLLQGQEFMQEGAFNDWQELEWDKTDEYRGMVEAHRHLNDLRKNTYGHTLGLTGNISNVIHQDDNNQVIAYCRSTGEATHDVVVVVNFSNQQLHDYHLRMPSEGTWTVRFNSSWKGYSEDFPETQLASVGTSADNDTVFQLAPYGVLILSK